MAKAILDRPFLLSAALAVLMTLSNSCRAGDAPRGNQPDALYKDLVAAMDAFERGGRWKDADSAMLGWSCGQQLQALVCLYQATGERPWLDRGVRKTHWEFAHNRVGSNDLSPNELCAVDTHPGMDGTFVVEANIFENLRHGVGIRDGSGIIQGNVFRNPRTVTNFRTLTAISISYGKHNNIPVDGCMPHDVEVAENVFRMKDGLKYETVRVGKAENITVDGKLLAETQTATRPAPRRIPRLRPMGDDGVLK